MDDQQGLLSIGALARATGVPAETLRTWERRYGFPSAERTDSGHRRYSLQTLERLRLVTRVLSLGHRPSAVVAADEETLRELLSHSPAAAAKPARRSAPPAESKHQVARALEPWFERVAGFESRGFERELRKSHGELGAQGFLTQRVGPFLTELGARWARGELGVRHEHFASERLREFLAAQWRPLSDASTGPCYVLATLPGELHVLGLHLVALTVALAGGRVVFLGADAPPDEIAGAVAHHSAEGVLISAARGVVRAQLLAQLARLREQLGPTTPVLIGGAGVGELEIDSAVALRVGQLSELTDWLEQRARA